MQVGGQFAGIVRELAGRRDGRASCAAQRTIGTVSQSAGPDAPERYGKALSAPIAAGPLFHLTDRGREPVCDLLADLSHNTKIALHDAPNVRGIILSTGALAKLR